MKKKNSLTFIDLFSGCGGLSCGLEMAGHHWLLGVDANKEAIQSFAQNHHEAEVYLGDIKLLKEKSILTQSYEEIMCGVYIFFKNIVFNVHD